MTMNKMNATICAKYGSPDVIHVAEVAKPIPRSNEILVKVMASAVNSGDVRVRSLDVGGIMKLIMRIVLGFNKPRKPILGTVYSGKVEQIGNDVKKFSIGDEVYGLTGFKFGAHAEYISISEKSIVTKKPANATFEESAAILFGGQTAIYFLKKAKIAERENPTVLIYGATGSVGTAAIQIAKHFKANVTAVCSTKGKALAEELNADSIILYDVDDFAKHQNKYDIIFDAVGKIKKNQCKSNLNANGQFLSVDGLDVAAERIEQLELLRELFEQEQYNATIDKVFSLDEIVEAHSYVDTGRKKGNVVLKIG